MVTNDKIASIGARVPKSTCSSFFQDNPRPWTDQPAQIPEWVPSWNSHGFGRVCVHSISERHLISSRQKSPLPRFLWMRSNNCAVITTVNLRGPSGGWCVVGRCSSYLRSRPRIACGRRVLRHNWVPRALLPQCLRGEEEEGGAFIDPPVTSWISEPSVMWFFAFHGFCYSRSEGTAVNVLSN